MSKKLLFNPVILSSNSGKPADHHKVITGAVVAALLMAIVGGLYWWMGREEVPVSAPIVIDQEAQKRNEILKTLSDSVYEPSPQEVRQISNTLSGSKITVTEEDRQSILDQLNK